MNSDDQPVGSDTDDLMAYYLQWTEESLGDLKAAFADFSANGGDAEAFVETMHSVAHNIKGMGTSFGFPLMTAAGTSFCLYLRSLGQNARPADQVIEAHLKSMDTVLSNRITGNGGESGEKLVARLQTIVEDALQTA